MMAEDAARPDGGDFDGLLLNLDRQNALYDELLTLSERERTAIGHADLAALVALVAEKERVIAEAQMLERQREALCLQWAHVRGEVKPPTLSDVQEWATSAADAARLRLVSVQLSQRVRRLRQMNSRNADIITQSQRMNEQLLAAALRHIRHPLYTHQGDTAADRRPSLILDYRV